MALGSDRDIITIKNLHLPYGIIAPNVWGECKAQPISLSLFLTLNHGIGSAADKDGLDQNTVHYGHVARRIRGDASSDQALPTFMSMVDDILYHMGKRDDHTFRLSESGMHLTFPKASMSGDSVEIRRVAIHSDDGTISSQRTKFSICGMKVMTLIGVNSNERQAKQALLVDLELCVDPKRIPWDADATARLFGVEHSLVQTIQDTSFETLESLAVHTLTQMQPVFEEMPFCSAVELRINKPHAIPFADAPGVVVSRTLKPSHL